MRSPRRLRARKSSMAGDTTIAKRNAPPKATAPIPWSFREWSGADPAEQGWAGYRPEDEAQTRAGANAGVAVATPVRRGRALRDRAGRDRSCASGWARAAAAAPDPPRFFLTLSGACGKDRRSRFR